MSKDEKWKSKENLQKSTEKLLEKEKKDKAESELISYRTKR